MGMFSPVQDIKEGEEEHICSFRTRFTSDAMIRSETCVE